MNNLLVYVWWGRITQDVDGNYIVVDAKKEENKNIPYVPYYVGISGGNHQTTRWCDSHATQNIPHPASIKDIQLFECETYVEMWGIEIALISTYGRIGYTEDGCLGYREGATLLNKSSGGNNGMHGVLRSDAEKKQQSIRAKLRISEKGHPQQGKIGANAHNSLTYVVTDPNGKSQTIRGITQFCKDNGLNPTTMVRVSKGKQKQTHGGWTCVKIEDI